MITKLGEGAPLKPITILTPKAYEWLILTHWRSEEGAIVYDPTDTESDPPSRFIIRIFPYGYTKVKFKWTELVATKKAAEDARCKDNPSKPKYESIITFNGTDQVLGIRTEFVNLRKYEAHPSIVKVRSSNGANMFIVILLKYKIFNPLAVIGLDDGLIDFTTNYVSQGIRLWAAGKDDEQIFRLTSNEDNQNDGHDIHDLIEKLNKDEFKKWGYEIPGFSFPIVAYADDSLDFQKIRQKVTTSKIEVEIAGNQRDAENKLTEAQANRNDTEIKFRREDAQIKEDLINKTAPHLASVNKAWGEGGLDRLIINGGNYSNFGQNLLQSHLEVRDFADSDSDDRRKPKKPKKEETQ